MAPPCQLCQGGLRKETVASVSTSLWEKLPPSSHPGAGQFSSSPNVSGALHSLSQYWSSKGVSLSLCVGPLIGSAKDFRSFCLPQSQSSLVFAARNCGDFSSWHWNPGLVGLLWGWDPWLLRYSS
ncbi:hypothetical protein HJG60_011277 [Phyllostomus discolor]|uniref:Uncharacterized protein n=1 Tax=Phyllostomus discolor TaxID=89673 RepID=A0A834E5A1_9CHIR|nr:hypothetical protein HJG60_011277 [Phyllostomus discolor]